MQKAWLGNSVSISSPSRTPGLLHPKPHRRFLEIVVDSISAYGKVLATVGDRDMNKAAQELGRLARGKPKHYSKMEIAIRTQRLLNARKPKRK